MGAIIMSFTLPILFATMHRIFSPIFFMAASPLGSLFSQSWSSFRSSLTPILIGALVFGTLMTATQMLFQKEVQSGTNSLMEGLGVDPSRLEDLNRRIEAGDESALQEMMAGIESATAGLEDMTEEEQAVYLQQKFGGAFTSMLPALGIGALISILISIIAWTYFSILALKGVQDPVMISRQTPGLILPMIGLSIWVMLRSFLWIPIIGIIPAIILLPRFVAAIVYLVRDGKGVLESARLSYGATAGYWGKIWGNWIALGVVFIVAAIVLSILAGVIGAVSSPAEAWVMQVVQQCISAFAILFSVKLALTILANPRMVAVAPSQQ